LSRDTGRCLPLGRPEWAARNRGQVKPDDETFPVDIDEEPSCKLTKQWDECCGQVHVASFSGDDGYLYLRTTQTDGSSVWTRIPEVAKVRLRFCGPEEASLSTRIRKYDDVLLKPIRWRILLRWHRRPFVLDAEKKPI
jgi:hypothetical protein